MKRGILKIIGFSLFITFSLLVILSATGCHKEHGFMNYGTIVGWNYGACATCGGFYLNLSPDTTISSSTYYVLDYPVALNGEIAGFFAQYNKNHLPIYVSVNWQLASLSDPGAPANWIRVLDIKAR